MTEEDLKQMVKEFPDSPMGWFSLGRHYLDAKAYQQAADALAQAAKLDPNYAAAWVALGDAQAALGVPDQAREAWNKALETPHGKRDMSLQSDLEQRLQDL
ncbi:MAG: tetratricopeptide repeat protein [Myxococcaceae bacterium]